MIVIGPGAKQTLSAMGTGIKRILCRQLYDYGVPDSGFPRFDAQWLVS
jgi:hypothetical protein